MNLPEYHQSDPMDNLIGQRLKNWTALYPTPEDGRWRLLQAATRRQEQQVLKRSRWLLGFWLNSLTVISPPIKRDLESVFSQAMFRSLEAEMTSLRLLS
ncbi:MAG: hypothetical protein AB1345_14820 [Chloroflexota bacterium]